EQEEAGQPELVDQRELLAQALACASPCARSAVALLEHALADRVQLRDGRLVAVREIRVAVAELLGQVELEPLGELGGARHGVEVVREALRDLAGREEDAFV